MGHGGMDDEELGGKGRVEGIIELTKQTRSKGT